MRDFELLGDWPGGVRLIDAPEDVAVPLSQGLFELSLRPVETTIDPHGGLHFEPERLSSASIERMSWSAPGVGSGNPDHMLFRAIEPKRAYPFKFGQIDDLLAPGPNLLIAIDIVGFGWGASRRRRSTNRRPGAAVARPPHGRWLVRCSPPRPPGPAM